MCIRDSVVTIHAPDAETLRRRPQYAALLQTGAFRHVAFLKGKETPGRISAVSYTPLDVYKRQLLMHAAGVNVGGQIASVIAGGLILNLIARV